MRLTEDLSFTLDYIMHSQSFADLDEFIYAYYQRDGSAVMQHRESGLAGSYKVYQQTF